MTLTNSDELPEPAPGGENINLPHLHTTDLTTQLIVNGEPFLILGGELRNSSSSSLEYMRPVWQRLANLNINTVLAAVSWELIESQEGAFDFSLVDGLIENARQYKLRLILLWFGSWKNGMSSYVPAWVKRDYRRFPLTKHADGQSVPVLSAFAQANWLADSSAFSALLRHIREVDSRENTVIMVQVENEVGLLGDARDHSAAADSAFASPVPNELLQYLQQHSSSLSQSSRSRLYTRWEQGGFRTAGSWQEVFGEGLETDEIFMAWHYARYVDRVSAAGRNEYPIPLFTNAWLNNTEALSGFPAGGKNPGDYPSGGPVPHLLDVWRAAAPHLDFLAPDIYAPDFDLWCAPYTRPDNPLFIPEMRADPDGLTYLFQAFATFNGIGTSPFGVDSLDTEGSNILRTNYSILHQLAPLLLKYRGSHKVIGFRLDAKLPSITRQLGGYELQITDIHLRYQLLGKPPEEPIKPGYGLIIATGPDTFVGAGFGFGVTFKQVAPSTMQVGIETVEEGEFRDGDWAPARRLNGDETRSGNMWRFLAGDQPAFGPMPPTMLGSPISRCTVYSYE